MLLTSRAPTVHPRPSQADPIDARNDDSRRIAHVIDRANRERSVVFVADILAAADFFYKDRNGRLWYMDDEEKTNQNNRRVRARLVTSPILHHFISARFSLTVEGSHGVPKPVNVPDWLVSSVRKNLPPLVPPLPPEVGSFLPDSRFPTLDHELSRVFRDDAGNALRLAKRFGNKIRYDDRKRRWFFHDGNNWIVDETKEKVMFFARETIKAILNEAAVADDDETRFLLEKLHKESMAIPRLKRMIRIARYIMLL